MSYSSPTSSNFSSPPRVIPVKFRRKSSPSEPETFKGFSCHQRHTTPPRSSIRPSSSPVCVRFPHLGEETLALGVIKKNLFGSENLRSEDLHHWAHNTKAYPATFSSYDEDPFILPPSDDILTSSDCSSEIDDAADDQCEEYDLEGMDIHLRESYFEISAERGRWKSSPIIPRTRMQMFASSPTRICSTPVTLTGWQTRRRKQSTNSVACTEVSTSSVGMNGEDRDESRFSPLPSSSPPTSPVSCALSLPEDCPVGDDDMITVQTPLSPLVSPTVPLSSFTLSYRGSQPMDDRSPSSDLDHRIHHPASRDSSRALPLERSGSLCANASSYGDDTQRSMLEPVLPSSSKNSSNRHRSRSPERDHNSPGGFHLKATGLSDAAGPDNAVSCSNTRPDSLPLTSEACHEASTVTSDEKISKKLCSNDRDATLARANLKANKASKSRTKRNSNPPSERPTKKCKTSDSRHGSMGRREPLRSCQHAGQKGGRGSGKKSLSLHPLDGQRTEACPIRLAPLGTEGEQWTVSPSEPCAHASPCPSPPFVHESSAKMHAELTGMLVEALATSRATSMDTPALYLALTRAHPKFKTERPEKDLLKDIGTVLEAGRARCGMFERVQSSGEVACEDGGDEGSGHGRWFYVPERDEDQERASLISSLAPRQKRSETKKYKQYYWRPLDRISRWDPEDAL